MLADHVLEADGRGRESLTNAENVIKTQQRRLDEKAVCFLWWLFFDIATGSGKAGAILLKEREMFEPVPIELRHVNIIMLYRSRLLRLSE